MRDYYFSLDNKSTNGLNMDNFDILSDDDKESIEGKIPNTFPKLDKLNQQVLGIQSQAEKISNLNIHKVPSKALDIKEKKKKVEISHAKKHTPNEEELIQAFKNEKNKFR